MRRRIDRHWRNALRIRAHAGRLRCLLQGAMYTVVLVASVNVPPSAAATERHVIYISLDAVRPIDLGRGNTPYLDRIARDGISASMRPVYPALTFPNHFTLATGLLPDDHGIVNNTMYDPMLGKFSSSIPGSTRDPRWWGAEPLWATAANHGVQTSVLAWPGIEGGRTGGLKHWQPFAKLRALSERISTVVRWQKEGYPSQASFLMVYFEDFDEAAHRHGPDSSEAKAALRSLDAAVASVVEASGGLTRNDVVVVSDHGMATVPPNHYVFLDDLVGRNVGELVSMGQSIGFRAYRGQERRLKRQLLRRHRHFACWAKHHLPTRWHYGRSARVPIVVCQADEGWDLVTRERQQELRYDASRGSHGYDPALPSMAAIFLAAGPSIAGGRRPRKFDNTGVYPFVARLLCLPQHQYIVPAPLAGALRPRCTNRPQNTR